MTSVPCFLAFTTIFNRFGVAIGKGVPIRLAAEYCLEILSAVAARKIAGRMPFGNSGQADARVHDCLDRAL